MDQETASAARSTFARWLSAEMRARRLSQRGLAVRSGVNHSTIARLLQGDRVPTLATATRLVEAMRALPRGETLAGPGASVSPIARVRAALQADPALREEDVAAVMRLYLWVRNQRPERCRA